MPILIGKLFGAAAAAAATTIISIEAFKPAPPAPQTEAQQLHAISDAEILQAKQAAEVESQLLVTLSEQLAERAAASERGKAKSFAEEDAARAALEEQVASLMAANVTGTAGKLHVNAARCAGEEAKVLKCYEVAAEKIDSAGGDVGAYLECDEAVRLYAACAKAAAPL